MLNSRSRPFPQTLRAIITASAVSELPVLLLGETGTGKQRLAEAIHRLDPRRGQGRFESFNCSTLHSQLGAGILDLIFQPVGRDKTLKSIELFGTQVLPNIREL